MFVFEKLEVYQKALQFVVELDRLALGLKGKVSYSLLDQLTRASTSICLNIAEGSGRWHRTEKRNFMVIARGSVFECIPILQIIRAKTLVSDEDYKLVYSAAAQIAKMLSGLISHLDSKSNVT